MCISNLSVFSSEYLKTVSLFKYSSKYIKSVTASLVSSGSSKVNTVIASSVYY